MDTGAGGHEETEKRRNGETERAAPTIRGIGIVVGLPLFQYVEAVRTLIATKHLELYWGL